MKSGEVAYKVASFIQRPQLAFRELAKATRVFETGVEERVADHCCVVEKGTVDKGWLCNRLTLVLVFFDAATL